METNNIEITNLSPDTHPFTLSSSFVRGETSAPITFNSHQNPRKKRTKFTRTDSSTAGGIHGGVSKPKPKTARIRPDPTAPKITRPCTECGKKFWSWKALFGHMRCHPERQWRGINPPPNFRRQDQTTEEDSSSVTEEDHEVATCLLMLASAASDQSPSVTTTTTTTTTVNQGTPPEYSDDIQQIIIDPGVGTCSTAAGNLMSSSCGRFECSSCKKVFGSHQALGGHRASHKNVKGCYAITKNDGEEEETGWCLGGSLDMMMMMKDNPHINGHKCSICLRVFSSGQALGGHMRCHWEKAAEDEAEPEPLRTRVSAFDLNLAVQEDHGDINAASSIFPSLDLRLGL